EIAERALLLRHIGLEAVLIIEKSREPLALDHQRIERIEDVHDVADRIALRLQHFGHDPMLVPRTFQRDGHQLLAPHARADQLSDRRLAWRIEMANRVEA